MRKKMLVVGIVTAVTLLLASLTTTASAKGHKPKLLPTNTLVPTGQVAATVETEEVPGGSADDPAIWIHPTDPSLSTIIGTAKDAGMGVYDLSGNQIQWLSDGSLNNVDIRYNFPLGGQSVALVTVSDRTHHTIAAYKVNPTTRGLENVGAISTQFGEPYGTCMYHSPVSGKYYAFVNNQSGEVEQWELFDNGSSRVDGSLVRTFDVGSQTEGCVADDRLADFYIGEEATGIWKYGAEPGDGIARTQVDKTGSGGHLTADVEGLTLYYASDGTGYLIASSQGSDEFVVYLREGNNDYVKTFKIVAGNGIDEVTNTDGIDVTNFPLGSSFPQGVFVAQDNDVNYKLVHWQAIANVTPGQQRVYLPIMLKND
jgi:3-phytase